MIYTVKTNLPPSMVTAIAVEIFSKWVAFALGKSTEGGRHLMHPSGQYAASISYQQEGEATVAIVADSRIANILEMGHAAIDLKGRMAPGHYRLKRHGGGSFWATLGANPKPDSWIIPEMPGYSVAQILAAQAQAAASRIG